MGLWGCVCVSFCVGVGLEVELGVELEVELDVILELEMVFVVECEWRLWDGS